MVAMIMMRTLHRDISKYNQLETADEAQEETGWKLVRLIVTPAFPFADVVIGGLSSGLSYCEIEKPERNLRDHDARNKHRAELVSQLC